MKLVDGYLKTTIAGVPYLLPYGQTIVNHASAVRLNDSGAILADALLRGADREELLALLVNVYEADASELPLLEKDLDTYLDSLTRMGIITFADSADGETNTLTFADSSNIAFDSKKTKMYFKIGPLVLACQGSEDFFSSYFEKFACPPKKADQKVILSTGMPSPRKNGSILVHNAEIKICDAGADYLFLFPDTWGIYEMHVKKDGSLAVLYTVSNFEKTHADDVFHALRFAFLILAQNRELYAVHSASLLYREKAWLFSGRSGAGKSTHTNLWNHYFDTPLLNGDLNLIGIADGIPTVYGIPWCGTSGICTKESYPLGGITFLKRNSSNEVILPETNEKALFLMQRMISPSWTKELLTKNIRFSEQITSMIPIFRLLCTKERSAAEVMKQKIDDCCSL